MSVDLELIRKNGGTVTAYDDAVVFHSAIGHDYKGEKRGVVFKGIGNELTYTIVGSEFRVLSGMGMLYGRQFRIPTGRYCSVSLPNTQKYVLVYVQIDTTGATETVSVNAKSSSVSINPNDGNTDIYKNASGVATMPLFYITWTGSSVQQIVDMREIRVPGEAETSRSIGADGTIDNNLVSDLIEPGQTGFVKKATNADVANSANGIKGLAINEHLYMAEKNAFIGTVSQITIEKSGEFTSAEGTVTNGNVGALIGYVIDGHVTYDGATVSVSGFVPADISDFYFCPTGYFSMGSGAISFISDSYAKAHVTISKETNDIKFTFATNSGVTMSDLVLKITCVKGGI